MEWRWLLFLDSSVIFLMLYELLSGLSMLKLSIVMLPLVLSMSVPEKLARRCALKSASLHLSESLSVCGFRWRMSTVRFAFGISILNSPSALMSIFGSSDVRNPLTVLLSKVQSMVMPLYVYPLY